MSKSEPYSVLEFITAEVADEYLKKNTHNRNDNEGSQSIIDKHASIYERGDHKVTHQGIAFDKNGVLLDGQNRLYGIIQAAMNNPEFKGVQMFVTRGLEPESQLVMDQPWVRQPHAQLTLMDYNVPITAKHTAIARAMAGGLVSRNGKGLRDIMALKRFFDTHMDAIQFAQKLFSKNERGISSAGVKAVVARAYYHLPHGALQRFAEVLYGAFPATGEEAILALKYWLTKGTTNYSAGSDTFCQQVIARTERALDAYMNGRVFKGHPRPVIEELYPLPEEVEAEKLRIQTLQESLKNSKKTKKGKLVTVTVARKPKLIKKNDRAKSIGN